MLISKDDFINELNSEFKNILEFWIKHATDTKNGGFYGEIDGKLNANMLANKGVVLNSRILWTFSAAYNFEKNPTYIESAHRAYNYLIDYFVDKINGGVFWELDFKGNVINGRKQAYAQGFALYGFTEYFKATRYKESLQQAKKLYKLIEANYYDSNYGGYIEALSNEWTPLQDMRLSPKDANEPKSMNTHLHILEPYTNLYRVWPDKRLYDSIFKLIRVFLDKILDSKTAHLKLFFDYNWNVKSSIVSYGHDIEGAWLLTEAAEAIGNKELLSEVKTMALRIADVTIAEGSDSDSSIFYEKEDGHFDTDKHWWPQAEAIIGFLNAYMISGKKHYLIKVYEVWKFIKKSLVDSNSKEWHMRVDFKGNFYDDDILAGFWKCPYHNTRAMIEAINRLNSNINF